MSLVSYVGFLLGRSINDGKGKGERILGMGNLFEFSLFLEILK